MKNYNQVSSGRLTAGLMFCLMLCALLAWPGCAWFSEETEKTADELIQDGMTAFEAGKYRKSLESFEKIKDWYPFSKYAPLAELKTADAHFKLKEYEDATFSYESFENLHPRNEAIPYVVYQIGMCHFNRIEAVDRDQSFTRSALNIFSRLIRAHPENEYAQNAEKHLVTCRKHLAGHEFYVGEFYYKGGHCKSAVTRFKTIIDNYPEMDDLYKKAQNYIRTCNEKMLNTES